MTESLLVCSAVLLHSGQCITQSQPYNCLLYDPACTCCFAEIAFNLQYPTLIQLSSLEISLKFCHKPPCLCFTLSSRLT